MRASLNEIGRKYQTDKSTLHRYLDHYESVLAPFRDESFDMLEIGVWQGASIRMWHEYFPAARIVGVDVFPVALEDNLPRFEFAQGSQVDLSFLHRLVRQHSFRLIIDDGSHLWGHQIFTFQTLFPWLAHGGIYICEDIQTSFGHYAEQFAGGAKESAASYFLRVAEAFVAGEAGDLAESADPLLCNIVSRIRSIRFIRHCVIITT